MMKVTVKNVMRPEMQPDEVQASCELSRQKQATLALAAPDVSHVHVRAIVDRDVATVYLHVTPQGKATRSFVRKAKLGKATNGVGLTDMLRERSMQAHGLTSAGGAVVDEVLTLVNVDAEITACLTAAWAKWAEVKHDFLNEGQRIKAKRRSKIADLANQVAMLGADMRRAAKAKDDETVQNAMELLTERLTAMKQVWTHTPRW